MLRKPLGEGGLYAAQIVGVGFHSFRGEGAASCETTIPLKLKSKYRLDIRFRLNRDAAFV